MNGSSPENTQPPAEATRSRSGPDDLTEQLRFVTDAAPLLLSYIDANLRYRFVNRGYAEWFGRPAEELLGQSVPEVIGSAAFEAARHNVERVLSGKRVTYEATLPYAEGERPRHVHADMIPDVDEDGTVRGYAAVISDISARHRAERRLEESEQRYRSLFEQNADAVYSFDLEGNFTSANAACEGFSGYSPAELLSTSFLPLIVPEDMRRTVEHFRRASMGEPQNYEIAILHKSGRRVAISVTNLPIVVRDTVVGVFGVAKNITERVEEERRQRFLADLAERTRFWVDPARLMEETLRSVGSFLGLSRCIYADIDTQAGTLMVQQDYFQGPGVVSVVGEWHLPPWGAVVHDLSEGHTTVNRDYKIDPRTAEDWETLYQQSNIRANVTVPLHRNDRWVAVFSAQMCGTPRDWTAEEVEFLETVAQRMWLTIENARLRLAEREAAVRQRRFLREMLFGLTEGRLRLCDTDADLPHPLPAFGETIELTERTLRSLRARVGEVSEALRFSQERMYDLETAVGEAAMNAVRHAKNGVGGVYADPATGMIQVWIRDQGTGIAEHLLHRAIERGWTTGGFGHGFWLMLRTADRVYLLTGDDGTTIVLEHSKTPPVPPWLSSTPPPAS